MADFIAHHSATPHNPSLDWVEVPAGQQPIPSWCKDLHIDFMESWDSWPKWELKTMGDPFKGDCIFRREGNRWMAVSEDGIANIHWHSGQVSEREVSRYNVESQRYEMVRMLATTKQEGYGGRGFVVRMVPDQYEGREVMLQGPWHGGAPDGFIEFTAHDMMSQYFRPYRKGTRWPQWGGGTFGHFMTEELALRLLARFQPHLRCARAKPYNEADKKWLQPIRLDWNCTHAQWREAYRKVLCLGYAVKTSEGLGLNGRGEYIGMIAHLATRINKDYMPESHKAVNEAWRAICKELPAMRKSLESARIEYRQRFGAEWREFKNF